MDYHAMHVAEHVSRYAFAAQLCAGKRVLDVACGEGYGAYLLAKLGAKSVLGVDISEEALAVARQKFAGDNVMFLAGDALQLPELLAEHDNFEVIVSFETIEHVTDAARFLQGVRQVLAPGGVVLLSCPNDAQNREGAVPNPYHVRTYSFAEFQQSASAILGPDGRWYLGTPIQGMIVAEANSSLLSNSRVDSMLLTEMSGPDAGYLLPAQININVCTQNCSFYIGVWGAAPQSVHVASPMSRDAQMEPWWALEWFKSELQRQTSATKPALRPNGNGGRMVDDVPPTMLWRVFRLLWRVLGGGRG